MTPELSLPAATLPGVNVEGSPSGLGRRLDRLRSAGTAPARRDAAPGVGAAPRRAAQLAAGLSGRIVDNGHGPVVVVDAEVAVPVHVAAFGRLPYEVDTDRPLVCLDLETTGLGTAAGTVPFLVGIGLWRGGTLRIRQLVLPDHSNEAALLSAVASAIPANGTLVTFNGRSFDWPLLVARYRLHRREPPPHAGHLDLLPVARQLWKHRLGGARLSLVETVAGVRRQNDLPGELVPEQYFRYLRSGDAGPLRPVLRHNRQDVVSLALLVRLLTERLASPEQWPSLHPGDLAGLARAFARRGRTADALDCLEAALRRATLRGEPSPVALRGRLLTERARLLARVGRFEEASAAWLEVALAGGVGAAAAWLWLARHREHRLGDAGGALDAAERAGAIAERSRWFGQPMPGVERDLRRRLPRLRRRTIAASIRRPGVGLPAA